MERFKIPMLSRFDAISHIMPYYSQTHRAFLLLSSLCSESRNKLDEFYDEFITHMEDFWMFIEVVQWNKWNHLFVPNDLFEVSIDFWFQVNIDKFIKFIENLRDSKGWYFNSHCMHSKIKIRDTIVVNINCIKELYPFVDVLKSTRVILCKKDIYGSKIQYESSTLDTNCRHDFLILKRTDIICALCLQFFFTNQVSYQKYWVYFNLKLSSSSYLLM